MVGVSAEPKLADLAAEWLRWKNTAKPSAHTYTARLYDLCAIGTRIRRAEGSADGDAGTGLDDLGKAFGDLRITQLTREALEVAFGDYAQAHSPASIRRVRSTWNGFCGWLQTHKELLDTNPIVFIEAPRSKRWNPKPLSSEELERVIRAAQQPSPTARNPWPELEAALCAIFVGAGVRISEAIGLRAGDIRRSATGEMTRLRVLGKGGVVRHVPLPDEMVRIVDRYLDSRRQRLGEWKPDDPLFVRPDGRPHTRRSVDHLVDGWFRRGGVAPPKGALAHALRHTYATLLVEQANNLIEVQQLLGHADLSTTQAYVGVAGAGLEAAAQSNPARRFLTAQEER